MKIEKDGLIKMRRPNDFHSHLREGFILKKIVGLSNIYGYVVAMGNLKEWITTAKDRRRYLNEINSCDPNFKPIVPIMLSQKTTPEIIEEAYNDGARIVKYIPKKASTNSTDGIPLENLNKYYTCLKKIRDLGMIFSGHWELPFDSSSGYELPELTRECASIPYLRNITNDIGNLKICVEHISTEEMVEFIKNAPKKIKIAGTITVHHMILKYENIFDGFNSIINPFLYSRPIAKHERDRLVLIKAATSGDPKFFFGSDSAPHLVKDKQNTNLIPAGIYIPCTVAITTLAEIFENFNSLENLEKFAVINGEKFYELEGNREEIKLRKNSWTVEPEYYNIVPFRARQKLKYIVEY